MARTLLERLKADGVVCAEGYLFELERRGYLQAGSFVPEVALDHPEALMQLHRDFLFCGSDVLVAFTYNGHREKMRIIGKEHLLEPLNRQALRIAKQAADEFDGERPLVAGNVSNTNIFDPARDETREQVRAMFAEMAGWAAEEGVDYMVAETFYYFEEARIALEEIKRKGLTAVVTFGLMAGGELLDGVRVENGCRLLEDAGADVVGMNCFRGPATMSPFLKEIREAVRGPVAALPIPYRTTRAHPTFFNIPDPDSACDIPLESTFPTALDPFLCNRYEVRCFAEQAWAMDIRYLGLCCGAQPMHIREIAEAIGRKPKASQYAPDMHKHFLFGQDETLSKHMTEQRKKV